MNGEDLQRALGRLEGELRGLRQAFERFVEAQELRFGDHERRLRALERWRWVLTGAGGLAGGLVGYFLRG